MSTDIPNLVARVHAFNTKGQIVPPGHFNAERVAFYTGMQLEELAEKIATIAEGHVVGSDRNYLNNFAKVMDTLGKEFKSGKHYGAVLRADRGRLLDDDIDQLVASAGSLVFSTPHFPKAISKVLDANDAKEWPDGTFHHDENGKITKPPGWTAADLSDCVDTYGSGE